MNGYKMTADSYRTLNDFKELDDDTKDRITNHVYYKFDTVTANQAEKYHNEH